MRWIASAATSPGWTTRADRERGAQLIAPRVELLAEERRRQRRVDEPRGDQVDADRRDLEREAGRERREGGGHRRGHADADARTAGGGAADEQQRAARTDLARGEAGHADHQHRMRLERAARGVEVHVGQRRVVRPARRRHDVVDLAEAGEERLQRGRVVGVEGRGVQRAELRGRPLQPSGIAAGQDHLGAARACAPRRLQPDARTAADHDDGLPLQRPIAGHRLSFRQLDMGGAAPMRAVAISAWSALSAPR